MFLLKRNFEEEGRLFCNFWFYIIIIYRKDFDFQCLSRCILMHFPIITGVENGRLYSLKIGDVLMKMVIWILISKFKVSSMLTSCFVF